MGSLSVSRQKSTVLLIMMIIVSILSIRSGKYGVFINLIVTCFLFGFYRIKLNSFAVLYVSFTIFLIIYGIIRGNELVSILEDIFAFGPFFLLFFGDNKTRDDFYVNGCALLANALLFLIPISICIYVYMDYGIGSMSTTRFNYNEDTNFELFAPILPLLYAPYLVFYFKKLSFKQKALVNIANLFIVFLGIITLSRSVAFNAVITYTLYYSYRFFFTAFKMKKLIAGLVIIIALSGYIISSGILQKIGLDVAIEGIGVRNEMQEENGNFATGRFDETLQYLNQNLSAFEYLFGRGMGGHKVSKPTDEFLGGINMLHLGPSHVFMKGGFFFLLLIYLPVFIGIVRYFKSKNNYVISLFLLQFFINNIQTTNWAFSIQLVFYWVSLAQLFYSPQRKAAA